MDNITTQLHGLNGYMAFQIDTNGIISKGNSIFCSAFGIEPVVEISIEQLFTGVDLEEVLKYNEVVFDQRIPNFKRHALVNAPFYNRELLFYRNPIFKNHKCSSISITMYLDDLAIANLLEHSSFEELPNEEDSVDSFVSITDSEGNFQWLSNDVKRILGYSKLEMLGRSRAYFMTTHHRKEMLDQFDSYFRNRLPVHGLKHIVKSKDGKFVTIVSHATPIFNNLGIFTGYRVMNQDISALVQDDIFDEANSEKLKFTMNSIKRSYEEMNSNLKKITDLQSIVSKVSNLFMSTPIDMLSESINESLRIIGETTHVDRVYIFQLHDDERYFSNTYEWCNTDIDPMIEILQNLSYSDFSWSMNRFNQGEVLNVYDVDLMSEEQQVEKSILQQQGIQSILLVPLTDNKKLTGFIGFDSVKSKKVWDAEISMIRVLSDIFSRTLIRMRNEDLLVKNIAKTRNLLEQTIESLASIVEINDPYTSGHQNRTAELANEIAIRLNLDVQSRELLHYSSLLHDLGKFYIPSQILNKPGKLSEIEFSMIKTHPSLGFQVLKRIDFPWPIADVVIQHHERIDGSGYPYGLIGDEIMIEARILAVADVVESMSSHRPYRPALGILAALDEIRKNSGILYDTRVAKVCLNLFEKESFKFSGVFRDF